MQESGSGYIWTESPADKEPAWQNAHYHKGIRETYIVERGMMVFASITKGGVHVVKTYAAGDVVTSKPGISHNVYLFPGTAIHTVKHGVLIGNPEKNGADWYEADPAFDAWTKSLPAEAVHTLATSS